MNWQQKIEQIINNSQRVVVKEFDIENAKIRYSDEIKKHENINKISGDEEVSRAFLINRLVNDLGYNAKSLEIEKRFTTGRKSQNKGENDVIVYDNKGNTFFFIEVKSPSKFEDDQKYIESQLFNLAKLQGKVKYLVWYTTDFQGGAIVDKAIIIDHEKYPDFDSWLNAGSPSVGNELPAGYGKPKKKEWIKGENDLIKEINKKDITRLAIKLHNYLWGAGGTTDSEIFYSLVNIILAKIQDEGEKTHGQKYDFQIFGYEGSIEDGESVYERLNKLYKRALNDKLGEKDEVKIKEARIIDRNKFHLNKLVFTVQTLEQYSFIEGRNSLDGRDILGDFFETITRDGFKQNKGQFFTPTPIVKFLVYTLQLDNLAIEKLNQDRSLPFIIDPSLGSGTFLVEAMKIITKELKYKQRDKILGNIDTNDRFNELFEPKNKENKWVREYVYGIEHNFDLGISSKVNMILHGDGSSNILIKDGLLPFRNYTNTYGKINDIIQIENTDSTYYQKDVNESFDVVISNPPFSVDLDGETKRYLPQSFLFAGKKNSENLFIERYYQLLKPRGRLGVVLPESVFDTTENKYIRLFIFKYFHVRAVVSLPQVTFEPYTSTKTSLLFAQRKNKKEVVEWQNLWDKYSQEWSELKTKIGNYLKVYLKNTDRKKFPSIKDHRQEKERKNIERFLKDYLFDEDKNLPIRDLLYKYESDIESLMKFDKDTKDVFGYVNTWWVFGEVAKEQDYEIFMAEVENVGYKRTKRGEKSQPNELYDIEIAPQNIDRKTILDEYSSHIDKCKNELEILSKNSTKKGTIKAVEKLDNQIKTLQSDKIKIAEIIDTYYENKRGNWTIKPQYFDRTDEQLLSHFQPDGVLNHFASTDVLLRKNETIKLLDIIRNEVAWL